MARVQTGDCPRKGDVLLEKKRFSLVNMFMCTLRPSISQASKHSGDWLTWVSFSYFAMGNYIYSTSWFKFPLQGIDFPLQPITTRKRGFRTHLWCDTGGHYDMTPFSKCRMQSLTNWDCVLGSRFGIVLHLKIVSSSLLVPLISYTHLTLRGP